MHRTLAALIFAVPIASQSALPRPGETLDVLPVWSAHPVGFVLWTEGDVQLVGCYDAERRMTIARRRLDETEWTYARLDSRLGWDSHNGVTMAVDGKGRVHVVGNMHGAPLVYFRTRRPLDIETFERVPEMVGTRERRMTYPLFLRAPDGRLVFRYRDGGSGNGDDILNVWDDDTATWSRLVDEPLLSGEGKVNGYFTAPSRGPDDCFHMVGIWRDTGDCATNHDVSYARSTDLVHWERADGTAVKLPMTTNTIDVVDPVPSGGGAINNNVKLGFDSQDHPIVSYHKYDAEGHTQVYAARFEDGEWRSRPVGDFGDYRWDFGGGGSIVFEVRIGAERGAGEGRLALDYSWPGGSGAWLLDEESLAVVGQAPRPESPVPASLRPIESDLPSMQRRVTADAGSPADTAVRYLLVWETLGPNRDRPREGPLPAPSMLRLAAVGTE